MVLLIVVSVADESAYYFASALNCVKLIDTLSVLVSTSHLVQLFPACCTDAGYSTSARYAPVSGA